MAGTLTIRLAGRLAEALEQESKQTGLPKGEIARQALEARLSQGGALPAMTKHFGAISGPSDLSTNRAYRRAWKNRP